MRYEQSEAFDRAGLAALTPKPTIAIVSGLYELFPDNAPVRESLARLAEAAAAGGYLLYTNQPWRPQLELSARTLTGHRGGSAWVMRRRTQTEMDQLVEAAGFSKLAQDIDQYGIFSVSLHRSVPEHLDAAASLLWPTARAALWMLILGPFFFLVYGLCNRWTAQHADIHSYYLSREKSISFTH